MELIKNNASSAEVKFSIDELLTIYQSLNEVCNGIDLFEFHTRIGVEKPVAVNLMQTICQIIDKIDKEEAN